MVGLGLLTACGGGNTNPSTATPDNATGAEAEKNNDAPEDAIVATLNLPDGPVYFRASKTDYRAMQVDEGTRISFITSTPNRDTTLQLGFDYAGELTPGTTIPTETMSARLMLKADGTNPPRAYSTFSGNPNVPEKTELRIVEVSDNLQLVGELAGTFVAEFGSPGTELQDRERLPVTGSINTPSTQLMTPN